MDFSGGFLGRNSFAYAILFLESTYEKEIRMRKTLYVIAIVVLAISVSGCAAFIVGGAVGAAGVYAASKDTAQGETDKAYDALWSASVKVARIRGAIKKEDSVRGYLELEAEASRVQIRLIRLTRSTTRLRISARKYHLPNLDLAQDIYVKIMNEAG